MEIDLVGRDENDSQYCTWLVADSDHGQEGSADPHQYNSTDHYLSHTTDHQYNDAASNCFTFNTHCYPQPYRVSSSVLPEVRFPLSRLYDPLWTPLVEPSYHDVLDQVSHWYYLFSTNASCTRWCRSIRFSQKILG